MNTVEKGDVFEKISLDIIKKAIERESLGISNHLKIFTKKGYYSDKRKDDIIFDISIEVWPPGANRYVLLYLIECKNYSSSVPVSDVEEFIKKMEQVADTRYKGIMISNNEFQKGGYNIAESMGLMLIRGESENDYEIILHKSNKDFSKIPSIVNAPGVFEEEGIKHIESIIDNAIRTCFRQSENPKILMKEFNIERLSGAEIEKIADVEIRKINPNVFTNGVGLTIKKIETYISEKLNWTVKNLDNTPKLLGACDFKNKTIWIHPSIENTSRHLFVLAHEFGHLILHSELMISQDIYDSFADSEKNFRTNRYELTNEKNWIEWQANYFAASLLMPKAILKANLYNLQNQRNLRNGILYVDDQPQNIQTFAWIIDRLAYHFGVTKTSIIYQLKKFDWLNDNSRLKSIGVLIADYNDELFF